MKFKLINTKLKLTTAQKTYLDNKLSNLEKYLINPNEIEAEVKITRTNKNIKIEVTIPVLDIILKAEDIHWDLYVGIDLAIDKLERQILKSKNSLKKHQKFIFSTKSETKPKTSKITKIKIVKQKIMTPEEAILQMNLLDHNFYLFQDLEGTQSIVYKRKDNDYGLMKLNIES